MADHRSRSPSRSPGGGSSRPASPSADHGRAVDDHPQLRRRHGIAEPPNLSGGQQPALGRGHAPRPGPGVHARRPVAALSADYIGPLPYARGLARPGRRPALPGPGWLPVPGRERSTAVRDPGLHRPGLPATVGELRAEFDEAASYAADHYDQAVEGVTSSRSERGRCAGAAGVHWLRENAQERAPWRVLAVDTETRPVRPDRHDAPGPRAVGRPAGPAARGRPRQAAPRALPRAHGRPSWPTWSSPWPGPTTRYGSCSTT